MNPLATRRLAREITLASGDLTQITRLGGDNPGLLLAQLHDHKAINLAELTAFHPSATLVCTSAVLLAHVSKHSNALRVAVYT